MDSKHARNERVPGKEPIARPSGKAGPVPRRISRVGERYVVLRALLRRERTGLCAKACLTLGQEANPGKVSDVTGLSGVNDVTPEHEILLVVHGMLAAATVAALNHAPHSCGNAMCDTSMSRHLSTHRPALASCLDVERCVSMSSDVSRRRAMCLDVEQLSRYRDIRPLGVLGR